MDSVRITYDSEGDTLYIAFGKPRGATGYQVSDQILLRLDPHEGTPAGLTVFNFIHHINSERGIELSDVDDELAAVLASKPLSQFLQLRTDAGRSIIYLREPSLREAVSTSISA